MAALRIVQCNKILYPLAKTGVCGTMWSAAGHVAALDWSTTVAYPTKRNGMVRTSLRPGSDGDVRPIRGRSGRFCPFVAEFAVI